MITQSSIELRIGCQVMCTKNIGPLVNGTLGILKGFESKGANGDDAVDGTTSWPLVEWTLQNGAKYKMTMARQRFSVAERGIEVALRQQVPLMLAWSLSIHKSQGQTLQRARVDVGRAFDAGMVYVALSRAVSVDALQVLRFNPSKVLVHDRVTEFYARLAKLS